MVSQKSRDDLIRERDESMRLYRGLIEAMPGGVVQVRADGAISYANEAALSLLGYSYDDITKRYASDWDPETIWEDGSPCRVEDYPVTRALVTGEPQPGVTIGIKRPDGETVWCVFRAMPIEDADGSVTGAVATFLDITARKRVEDELRNSAAILKSVLDHAPSLIVETDLEGTIAFINRIAPHLAEDITSNDVVGHSVFSFINERDHEMVREAIRHVVKTGEPAAYEVQGLDGLDSNWWSTRLGPVINDGQVEALLLVVTNITERKQAELEREDLRARLIASQRLEAIGRLAGGIAHDFNNLLTVMLGSVDMLSPMLVGTPMEELTKSIRDSANRAARLTRQLLAFSGRQVLEPSYLRVDSVIEGVVDMFSHLLGEGIEVQFLPGDVGAVFADVIQLERVIVNLATNARDAMPDGGKLVIRTHEQGDTICIDVIDEGAGMDEHTRRHMFEPFYTTKGQGEGTGLGLATVHGIVTQSGGELEVDSELGRGTRITVRLPRATKTGPSAQGSGTSRVASKVSTRVLLVEDAASVRGVVKQILVEEGYVVDDVTSPLDVIELGPSDWAAYQLLVTDVVMPKMSGPELAAKVIAHNPDMRILFMSGYTEVSTAAPNVDAKAVAFVPKPFTAEALLGAVRKLLSP